MLGSRVRAPEGVQKQAETIGKIKQSLEIQMVSRLFLFILPARTAIWKQFSRGLFVGLSEGRLFSHDLPIFHWLSSFCINAFRVLKTNFTPIKIVEFMGTEKRSTSNVLFIIKKSKLLKNGEAPICMRITVNKQIAEVAVKRSIPVDLWNQKKSARKAKTDSM